MRTKLFHQAQLVSLLYWARETLPPEDQALVMPHLVWAKSSRSKGFYAYKGGYRIVGVGLYRAMLKIRERQRESVKGTGLFNESDALWQLNLLGTTLYDEWVWE